MYPESLPKIDFAYYKSKLPKPAMADEFQKAEKASKAFIARRQDEINDAKLLLSKIDSLPKPEEMTLEMFAYYFPDKALDPINRPTFWPHVPSMQPGHKDNKLL
nr:hypothetical protein BaRGS_010281 [Batillaria attramentaria]KAG5704932.1 hypothetical protein BaRGS_003915 [Batillaria attramentaria]